MRVGVKVRVRVRARVRVRVRVRVRGRVRVRVRVRIKPKNALTCLCPSHLQHGACEDGCLPGYRGAYCRDSELRR